MVSNINLRSYIAGVGSTTPGAVAGKDRASPLTSDDAPTIPLPVRPGTGTLGRKISLRANHFSLNVDSIPDIGLYDVVRRCRLTSVRLKAG